MMTRSWLPVSLLLGLALTTLALGWLRYGFGLDDERLLLQASTLLQQGLTPQAAREADAARFTFIDTSYDLALVEATGADGFPLGNRAITDRAALARLLRRLARADAHRLVLCDVLFDTPSPDDAALQAAFDSLRRAVVPTVLDADGRPHPLVIDAPAAVAAYRQEGGSFVRFPLVAAGSLATVPLAMHRALHPGEPVRGPLRLDRFIPDLRLPPSAAPAPVPLGQLLLLPEATLARDYFADRIVVVGAFAGGRDRHATALGSMPGPLLLANVYLALRYGDHVLTPGLLAFLWLALAGLTGHTLRTELGPRPAASARGYVDGDAAPPGTTSAPPGTTWRGRLRELGADGVEHTLWLAGISMIVYFGFGLHLPVLLLAVALTALTEALRYRAALRRRLHRLLHRLRPAPHAPAVADDPAPQAPTVAD